MKAILWWVFFAIIAFSYANSDKLDYRLLSAIKENEKLLTAKGLTVKVEGKTINIQEVKVLTKDGKVQVVNLSRKPLQMLIDDPDIVYIEAPRKVRQKNDIVRDTSYVLYGWGNQTISIIDPGKEYQVYIFPSRILDFNNSTGNCITLSQILNSDLLLHCTGDANFSISALGDFRVVVEGAELSNIFGYTEAYVVGTKSWNTLNDGSGVIIGIIDSGINFCHPAFLDSNGNTRVKFYAFVTDQTTCQSKGGSYDANTQICELGENVINQKINNNECSGWDNDGHGTHVSGIAAGSDQHDLFGYGIAPGADLIVFIPINSSVNYSNQRFIDTQIIKGLEYIKQKAQQLGKPAVVNMSLGVHYDPHDGTGTIDKKVDELSGNGFIVAVAQSNEGDKPLHAFTINTSDTVRITVPEVKDQNGNLVYEANIIGWYKNPSQWKIEVCEVSTSNCIGTQSGNNMSFLQSIGNTGCSARILASMTNDPLNGDGRFEIKIKCQSSNKNLDIRLVQICGDVARVDMWDVEESGIFQSNYLQDPLGGYLFTLTSPGTAKRAITVGAINSRPIITTTTDDSFKNIGKIANFSSRGPTKDGRMKPNVVAGGAWVCSANNIFPNPQQNFLSCDANNYYVAYNGTSMATPVVSGLIALYLQGDPNASPEDIKKWLTSNAVQDVIGFTYPNNIYGYGKAIWSGSIGKGGSFSDARVNIPTGSGVGSCSVPSQSSGEGGGGGCSTGSPSVIFTLLVLSLFVGIRKWFKF